LSKAVKEHERRDGRKEGFTESPGDVLAYKHYRDVSRLLLLLPGAASTVLWHESSSTHTIHQWLRAGV
jgi:hypothetical protein